MNETRVIPVVLFTYSRSTPLKRVLDSLRENDVPLLYVFSDGPRSVNDKSAVNEVRRLVDAVDWCSVHATYRDDNFGLGRNVVSGVSEVSRRHESFIVVEDDLPCLPGAYHWLCSALRIYRNDFKVMSISGWTHSRVRPPDVNVDPYFDGRAECWLWGSWSRAWSGMENDTAMEKVERIRLRGIPSDVYGDDLPEQAALEQERNLWAARWLYHHIEHGGLCLRPPWSMVNHIGTGEDSSNSNGDRYWKQSLRSRAPQIPRVWPKAGEHSQCQGLWRRATRRSAGRRIGMRMRRLAQAFLCRRRNER